MIARALRYASLFIAVGSTTADAQPAAAPAPAFRFERPIVSGGSGPRRLPIDVPLLVRGVPFRAREGLRDLRMYDASGLEIGYLLVRHTPPAPEDKSTVLLPVASVDTPTERTSGFEADLGEPIVIDRFRIDGLSPPFLKRVTLEGSGDREHWTLLVAEGTLFDLPDDRLRHVELRFAPGSYRYLRLTWDDTRSGRLPRPPAAFAGRVPPDVAPVSPLTTPIAFERRPSEPGRSRFRLRLPGGHLPIAALHLDVGGGHIFRDATVFEARLSGTQLTPVMLGHGTLTRVVRDNLTAADLHIAIETPAEAQLDLDVDDGDNPPLDLRGVTAEFVPLPWIYFEAPAAPLTARYGNSTVTAPHYDLEAARNQIRIDAVRDATWGEPRARSAEENAAAAAPPLPTVGASIDPGLFKYVRTVPPGSAGLVAVAFDAQILAHSAGPNRDFGDVRVVDAADRQIPYIVEHAAEPLSLDLDIEKLSALPKTLQPVRANRSVYRVTYPVGGLPPSRLVLTTPARVFDRRVIVAEHREPDDVERERRRDPWLETLATARWAHANQDVPAMPLTVSVLPPHGTELLVIVDEGDNTPLPIASARLLLPSYRIRLFRGANARLRVAYGRADASKPQYDLALLAPQVLGTPAADVALDAEQRIGSVQTTAAFVSPRVFWGALTIAVIVLLGLIGRLLKKESAG